MKTPLGLATVIGLTLTSSCVSGYEEHSYSKAPAAFLSDVETSVSIHINFDSPHKMMALRDHCNKNKALYAYRDKRKYKCQSLPPDYSPEGTDYWRVKIIGPSPAADEPPIKLFSWRPYDERMWETKAPTDAELTKLASHLANAGKRYSLKFGRSDLLRAIMVFRSNESPALVLVPGKPINDGEYEIQRHHSFLVKGNLYEYQGVLEGQPTVFVDLNDDDIPEIMAGSSCDGTCITVWDVNGNPRPIMTFSGH